jgi:hypothetical protein
MLLLLCPAWLPAPAESPQSGPPACTQWGLALLPRHHLMLHLHLLLLLLHQLQTAVA